VKCMRLLATLRELIPLLILLTSLNWLLRVMTLRAAH
jgi:hypothetical protein